MLVAGEDSAGHAVILHQLRPAELKAALLLEAGLEQVDHARGLKTHGHVHAVGEVILGLEIGPRGSREELVLGLLLADALLQALPLQRARGGHGVGEGVEEICPVQRLVAQLSAQLQQVLLAREVVQPQRQLHVVAAAGHGPVLQGLFVQTAILILEEFIHQHQHAPVVGGGEVLPQRLERHHQRPVVLVLLRAEPAVLALAGEDPLDIAQSQCPQFFVLQRPCQRHQSVQIVGRALPAVAASAQPCAVVAHVGPLVVQRAGEVVGLNAQLIAQPALRANGAERQRREGVLRQRSAVEHRFHALAPRTSSKILYSHSILPL